MLSNTVIAAAAFAATVATYELPTCWTTCFEQYEIDSQGSLCTTSLSNVVHGCISAGCNSANSTAYSAWLSGYCNSAPVSSNTWSAPASTYIVPATSSLPTPLVYSTPSTKSSPAASSTGGSAGSSSPLGSAAASGTATATGTWISTCTEMTTQIWRSTTATVPVTIVHSPGGWSIYSSPATGTSTASGGSSSPTAVAQGAAAPLAKVGAGVAALVGGAAVVLL